MKQSSTTVPSVKHSSNTTTTNIVDFPGCEVSQAIARTATEIAAKFVDDNASERAPYKVRVLAYGAVSTLSDGAFRLLVIRSMYADANGANSRPTQEVLAELMRREERTISTLDKELRKAGFITLGRRANNRSHDPSLRSTSYNLITHTQMDNIVNEIVNDRKRTSGRNPDNDQKLASAGKYDRKPTSTGSGFHRKSSAVSTGSELPPTLLTNPSTETKCLTNNSAHDEISTDKLRIAAAVIAAALAAAPQLGAAAAPFAPPPPAIHSEASEPAKKEKPAKAERTRMPADWFLPQSWGQWSTHSCRRDADWVRTQASKFKEYWLSVPDTKAFKVDWKKTWQNWCKNALEREAKFNSGKPFVANSSYGRSKTKERLPDTADELFAQTAHFYDGVL